MITQEVVAQAWKTLWDADGSLPGLVPGGLWSGPVPEAAPAGVYATLAVTEGPPQWTTGTAYWQVLTVEVRVWSSAGVVSSGAIRAAMLTRFRHENKDALDIGPGGAILGLLPEPGELKPDARRKAARDVLATGQRWKLTIQGVR